MVNKPKHYQLTADLEVIDVHDLLIPKAATALNPVQLCYYSHLMLYLMRFSEKGGMEDLEKARWYLDRILCNKKGMPS